jgi:hypothetical protein
MVAAEPFRDRTGEIDYWRRSYASVLLSPTGKAPIYDYPPADAEFDETHIPDVPDVPEHFVREPDFVSVPTPLSAHPPLPRPDAVSLPSTRGQSMPAKNPSPQLTLRSFSRPLTTPATDAPVDLESRVAKLEAHLVDFQRSLSNLALSSPSAVAPTEPPGSSHHQKPPSIFVEPLQAPPRSYEDAGDIMEREWGPSSQGSTNGDRSNLAPPTLRSTVVTANGTFTALYNMLSEERSARRTLENQVRNLQHEVTRLQLSRGSWVATRHKPFHKDNDLAPLQNQMVAAALRAWKHTMLSPRPPLLFHLLSTCVLSIDLTLESKVASPATLVKTANTALVIVVLLLTVDAEVFLAARCARHRRTMNMTVSSHQLLMKIIAHLPKKGALTDSVKMRCSDLLALSCRYLRPASSPLLFRPLMSFYTLVYFFSCIANHKVWDICLSVGFGIFSIA